MTSLFWKLICSSWRIQGTSEVFVVRFSKKGSLSEGLQCGCLSQALPLLSRWSRLYGQ